MSSELGVTFNADGSIIFTVGGTDFYLDPDELVDFTEKLISQLDEEHVPHILNVLQAKYNKRN